MTIDIRPSWLSPIIYDDEPPPARPVATEDQTPIDYSKRTGTDVVFGDDLPEEDEEPE